MNTYACEVHKHVSREYNISKEMTNECMNM